MSTEALTAILASRICHDLISPVGAICNGIALIKEVGDGSIDEELRMIGQSAERASRMLQFYRIAFGAASEASALDRAMLAEMSGALIGVRRIMLDWADRSGPPIARRDARLLLIMLLCGNALVGMRGTIRVVLPAQTTMPATVVVEGDGVPAEAALIGILQAESDPDDIAPQHVEFALLREAARVEGVSLSARRAAGAVMLSISRLGAQA